MGSIVVNGELFFFEEIDLSHEPPKVLDKKVAKENLLIFKKVLERNNVRFLLMHGTLLGAMRENDFIAWDCDIDTYVYDEKLLINTIPELCKEGLRLCRYSKIEYSFIRNGVYIDAFVSHPCKQFYLRPFFCEYQFGRFPKKFFNKTQKLDFLGEKFEVPYKPEKILRYFYGAD